MINGRKILISFNEFGFSNQEALKIVKQLKDINYKGEKISVDDIIKVLKDNGLDDVDATLLSFEVVGITERNDI
ncbi:hypothetical protein NUT37_03945 [Staphylococcus haemolyticus]|nr:hypothetical protein NUT37_03945 [Staphylococcus haemolyticus]